jgi:selenoprotein W-related protein
MAGPQIVISYCTQCRWLLRASWLAQELLTTFAKELSDSEGALTLRPGTGGVFQVQIDEELVWDRSHDGGFPDVAVLKRMVRDRIAPGRNLGHIDRAARNGDAPGDAY